MTTTTKIWIHNNIDRPTSNVVSAFLKPVNAEENYRYSPWYTFNPAFGGFQFTPLTNKYTVSVRELGQNSWTVPYEITPGAPVMCVKTDNQGLRLINERKTDLLTGDEFGVYNGTSPATSLQVTWYVNGGLVAETNNDPKTALNAGFVSSFLSKPAVYLMSHLPRTDEPKYSADTLSALTTEIAFNSDDTDVYIGGHTDANGIDTFRKLSRAEWAAVTSTPILPTKS